jgi:type VI secretion system protein ImpA
MPSPEVLDFAKLLAPISAEKPTGIDPRLDISSASSYQKIKDARRDARALERQAAIPPEEGRAPPDPPNWQPVRALAVELLGKQAKDLEVTAFLIEALARLDGFAGMRDGFRLARELIDKYWDTLYPLPDEEGLAVRTCHLAGLNGEDADGTLIAPIARVPLTADTSAGEFSQSHYNEANALKKISDPKELKKRMDAGAVALEKVQKAVSETPGPFYHLLVEDLNACTGEFTKLGEALTKRCGAEAPPTSKIRDALAECLVTVKALAQDKLKPQPAKPEASANPTATAQAPAPPPDVLQTREQALQNLQKVADFFRRTEPHSPVSYALEQVVRWGGMALPDLWTELIADEAPRKNVFKLVGIKK